MDIFCDFKSLNEPMDVRICDFRENNFELPLYDWRKTSYEYIFQKKKRNRYFSSAMVFKNIRGKPQSKRIRNTNGGVVNTPGGLACTWRACIDDKEKRVDAVGAAAEECGRHPTIISALGVRERTSDVHTTFALRFQPVVRRRGVVWRRKRTRGRRRHECIPRDRSDRVFGPYGFENRFRTNMPSS